MNIFKSVGLCAAVMLIGLSTACSFTKSAVNDVTTLVTVVEAAVPVVDVIAAAHPQLVKYVNQAATAGEEVALEAASSDTSVAKAQAIRADLASLILPDLSGLPASDQAIFVAINVAVQVVLNDFPSSSAALSSSVKTVKVYKVLHPKGGFSSAQLKSLSDSAKRLHTVSLHTAK